MQFDAIVYDDYDSPTAHNDSMFASTGQLLLVKDESIDTC